MGGRGAGPGEGPGVGSEPSPLLLLLLLLRPPLLLHLLLHKLRRLPRATHPFTLPLHPLPSPNEEA